MTSEVVRRVTVAGVGRNATAKSLIAISVTLFGAVFAPIASLAQPVSLGALMATIDPSRDPAVRWFATARATESPHWYDHIRWSADATASYDYAGTASLATSASLTVPIDAFAEGEERARRARIEAERMALERDAAARDLTYGMLDVACRIGYLRTIGPLMAASADRGGREADLWNARVMGVADEMGALDAQLAASAPGLLEAMDQLAGFMCLLPPMPTMDGLDDHPSLRRIALETAQEAYQLAVFRDTGGPEVALAGSLRYAADTGGVDADVQLSARIPFSTAGAHGSVAAETDPWGARIRVRLDASTLPEEQASFHDLDHRIAQERAALAYQIAAAAASYRVLQIQFENVWPSAAALGMRSISECASVCILGGLRDPAPETMATHLELVGLGYEVARAQLELMRLLAIDPAVLDDSSPAAPVWAETPAPSSVEGRLP